MLVAIIAGTKDDERGRWLNGTLSGRFTTFYRHALRPGQNWVRETDLIIERADVVLVVASPAFASDPAWMAFFDRHQQGGVRFIPVVFERHQLRGLLRPFVALELYGLPAAAAAEKLFDAVESEIGRPAEAAPFPGDDDAPTRPEWRRLDTPATTLWRESLDGNVTRHEPPVAEVHLVPVRGDSPPWLSVGDLEESADALKERARASGLFPVDLLVTRRVADPVRPYRQEAGKALLVSGRNPAGVPGLAIAQSGQRSAWTWLLRRDGLTVLDRKEVTAQIRQLVELLAALPLPQAELVAPTVGIEPAQMVTVAGPGGEPAFATRPQPHVRPIAGEALDWHWLRTMPEAVSATLAARLDIAYRDLATSGPVSRL